MATTPTFPNVPAISPALTLASAEGVAFADLLGAPAGGSGVMIGRLRATSDDDAAVVLQFARSQGGTDRVMGEVQVPAGSGTNGTTAWTDLLASLNLGAALTLAPGETLRVRTKTAVAAARKIDITGEAAPL